MGTCRRKRSYPTCRSTNISVRTMGSSFTGSSSSTSVAVPWHDVERNARPVHRPSWKHSFKNFCYARGLLKRCLSQAAWPHPVPITLCVRAQLLVWYDWHSIPGGQSEHALLRSQGLLSHDRRYQITRWRAERGRVCVHTLASRDCQGGTRRLGL